MVGEVVGDGGFELGHGVEGAAAQAAPGGPGEVAFGLVGPGGAGGREAEDKAGMPAQPCSHLGSLVRGIVLCVK